MNHWEHVSRAMLIAWLLTISLLIALSLGQPVRYVVSPLPWDMLSDGFTIMASR